MEDSQHFIPPKPHELGRGGEVGRGCKQQALCDSRQIPKVEDVMEAGGCWWQLLNDIVVQVQGHASQATSSSCNTQLRSVVEQSQASQSDTCRGHRQDLRRHNPMVQNTTPAGGVTAVMLEYVRFHMYCVLCLNTCNMCKAINAYLQSVRTCKAEQCSQT